MQQIHSNIYSPHQRTEQVLPHLQAIVLKIAVRQKDK